MSGVLSGLGGWLGSGASLVVAGLCILVIRHMHRVHKVAHPWLGRAIIAGMYCAGAAFTFTPAGQYVVRLEQAVLSWFGGTSAGIGWAAITIASLFLGASVVVALIWEPAPGFGWYALAIPLVMTLARSGFAHELYSATAYPAQQAVTAIATWAGG